MRICFIVLSLVMCASRSAFACPRLEGRFECRTKPSFKLDIRNEFQNGLPVYTFSSPDFLQTIIPDGAIREMIFPSGKGTYSARCEGHKLIMIVRGPRGGMSRDQYYIENAALVKVRMSPGRPPESLSCRPIEGTWNLYPR